MRSCPVTSQSQISRTRPGNSIFQVMVNFIKALRSQFTSLESHLTKIIFTAYPARVVNNDHRVFVRLDKGFDFISEKANRGFESRRELLRDRWLNDKINRSLWEKLSIVFLQFLTFPGRFQTSESLFWTTVCLISIKIWICRARQREREREGDESQSKFENFVKSSTSSAAEEAVVEVAARHCFQSGN